CGMTAPTPTNARSGRIAADNHLAEIQAGLDALTGGELFEVRIPKVARRKSRTASGYYTGDTAKAARELLPYDGRAEGIFVTINRIHPDAVARSENHMTDWAEFATSDNDIIRITKIPIDLDAKRPSGVSSREEHHQAALHRLHELVRFLTDNLGIARTA